MAEALTAFAIFVVIAVGTMVFLNKRTRDKMRENASEEAPPRQTRISRRQQRFVATLEPAKPLPTIDDLVAEEAAATGVNDIPGGEGLDVSLKLRVYWRDEVVRRGCDDGHLEFRLGEGVSPQSAATEDVRLVCVRDGVVATAADGAHPSDHSVDAPADASGHHPHVEDQSHSDES